MLFLLKYHSKPLKTIWYRLIKASTVKQFVFFGGTVGAKINCFTCILSESVLSDVKTFTLQTSKLFLILVPALFLHFYRRNLDGVQQFKEIGKTGAAVEKRSWKRHWVNLLLSLYGSNCVDCRINIAWNLQHARAGARAHTFAHTHSHAHTRAYTSIHRLMYTHTRISTHARTHLPKQPHSYTRTHTLTSIHTRTRTHTHALAHTPTNYLTNSFLVFLTVTN